MSLMKIVRKTFQGLWGLLSGMVLTLGYFLRFDKVITQQYPENRATLKLPPRFRGKLELIKDPDNGLYKCSACGLCVRACPNNSIGIEKVRDPATNKQKLVKYEFHFERCTVCGLCVDACRFDALRMGQDFETGVYDRAELTEILNKDHGQPPAPPLRESQSAVSTQPEHAPAIRATPAQPTVVPAKE
jgi:NADH-quinone oxidoreductase subunit I